MDLNRKIANVLCLFWMLTACFAAWIFYRYLPLSTERWPLTLGCLTIGVLSAAALNWIVMQLPNKIGVRWVSTFFFVAIVLIPMLSTARPRITYSRFGLTVYGVIPVPVLDVTVNQYGILWFRPKTHQITRAELDAIISPSVEIIIVGIGWDSIAQLTDEAKLVAKTMDLRVLPTGDAFALFNELKAQGRRVALIAHSTC